MCVCVCVCQLYTSFTSTVCTFEGREYLYGDRVKIGCNWWYVTVYMKTVCVRMSLYDTAYAAVITWVKRDGIAQLTGVSLPVHTVEPPIRLRVLSTLFLSAKLHGQFSQC